MIEPERRAVKPLVLPFSRKRVGPAGATRTRILPVRSGVSVPFGPRRVEVSHWCPDRELNSVFRLEGPAS